MTVAYMSLEVRSCPICKSKFRCLEKSDVRTCSFACKRDLEKLERKSNAKNKYAK